MSNSMYRDLSAGSRSLIIIEQVLCVSALFLAIYFNRRLGLLAFDDTYSSLLLLYAILFALINQLSSLALGLYNSKLRENFRGLFRRILMSASVGFCAATLANPFYGTHSLPIEIIALASLFSFILSFNTY